MYKLENSDVIELTAVIGIEEHSRRLKRAQNKGYQTFLMESRRLIDHPNLADIVFDATSAKAHLNHARILKEMGKKVVDLTPAAVGPFF